MLGCRWGRPSVARTAAVAGTATAVSNRVSRRQGQRWQEQGGEQAQAPPAQQQPAPSEPSTIEQLKQLGELKTQGVLTEEEFAAEKARVLGS